MKHTATAVKLIRAKLLLQGTTETPNDSMVGAVALLVIIESMQDDRTSSEVHRDGLNKMVAARGGFEAFAGMKTLQRIISWYVLSTAHLIAKRLTFLVQGSTVLLVALAERLHFAEIASHNAKEA